MCGFFDSSSRSGIELGELGPGAEPALSTGSSILGLWLGGVTSGKKGEGPGGGLRGEEDAKVGGMGS